MNELATITTGKQALRNVLNSNELNIYRNHNGREQFDISSNNDSDQLLRKTTLLKRKGKILEKTTVAVWNNFTHIFCINSILSISALQFGYGLSQITTVWNLVQLNDAFGFTLPDGLSLGMMVAFLPIGGFFGCLAAPTILGCLRRNTAHLLNNILCIIATAALMQINTVYTLLIGRFFYGWTIACSCYWSPLVIRQISPVNLRESMASLFNISRMIGIMLGYLLGLIFYSTNVTSYYRIMFCIPAALALIQIVLMFCFVPHSPTELFQRHEYEHGRQVLTIIYKQEFVDLMFDKFKLEAEVAILKLKASQVEEHPAFRMKAYKAMVMGVHLNIFRELLGLNTIVCYAGLIMAISYEVIAPYTNFMISGIVVICSVIATLFVANHVGRKCLLIFSSALFTLCNLMIALGLLIKLPYFALGWMIVLMGTYGLVYSPVSWAYPTEILAPQHVHSASIASWPALVFTTLIPPIVSDVIPNHTPWPMFIFYGAYCLCSTIYMWRGVVESKRREYVEIINDF